MNIVYRLPGPVADLWEWQFDGSCRRENPDVFFHPTGERGPSRRNRDNAAKAVCLTCPVLKNCREHALQVQEPYGVWGGMTEDEREERMSPQRTSRPRAEAITDLIPAAREHRPGLASRAADLQRHHTLECSPSGRTQRDITPLKAALEVATCARS